MEHKEYIRVKKEANTAVLFIHGILGSPRHFDDFIKNMPENISVYNMLLKGHGKGVKDFAKASMKEWKKQTAKLSEKLCREYDNVIIAAHSMGTFFAMEEAVKHPDKIKHIFLLQSPLKIAVKPMAFVNTFKVFFNIMDDEASRAYKNSHSIKLNMRLWEYIGWIPRYLELFKESKDSRSAILKLKTPCSIYQSAKDELVSKKSVKYIPDKPNIKLYVLENSTHFIYDKNDFSRMLLNFVRIVTAADEKSCLY